MKQTKQRTYRFRFTLASRLMLYFIIFGVAIGYLTFFFTSFINPILMVQRASKHILEYMEASSEASIGKTLEKLLEDPGEKDELDRYLTPLINDRELLKDVVFYEYEAEKDSWLGRHMDDAETSSPFVPEDRIISRLETIWPTSPVLC